jgi:hypothetical protein
MFYPSKEIIPGPLEQLLLRETFAEILACMTPEELAVAALRLEGLTDHQIAALLGLEPSAISQRMIRAQERIVAELPEAAHLLGRRRLPGRPRRNSEAPLERGLVCDWRAPNDRRRRGWRQSRRTDG